MSTVIESVRALQVLDSRGKPTVEVEVRCAGARPGRAIVPSGASTGHFEAIELRDVDEPVWNGNGVTQAVGHVNNEIAAAIVGSDGIDQQVIDAVMCQLDGTPNKSRLGANAILGVSLATAYATAEALGISPVERFQQIWQSVSSNGDGVKPQRKRTTALGQGLSMPLPMVNMISGGLHAGRNLDFQDFLILPVGAESYSQALEWIVRVYHRLGKLLTEKGYEGVLVGDEGGFGPKLTSNSQAAELVVQAIELSSLQPGTDVALGLDVASSHFYKLGRYVLSADGGQEVTAAEFVDVLADWVDRYPIVSIEDGLAEDDWEGWQLLTEKLSDKVQLIGDDLFVTNRARLEKGVDMHVGNSVLIKLNQIGSLWETLETLRYAIDHDYWPVVSARSGETEDVTIADLVVATGAGQLKVGSVARSERLAKYNHLLRMEQQLGDKAPYAGTDLFSALH